MKAWASRNMDVGRSTGGGGGLPPNRNLVGILGLGIGSLTLESDASLW